MPYTKPEERKKYIGFIEDAVRGLSDSTKSFYSRGEFFGYFVNRLVKRFMRVPDIESEVSTSFNARTYPEALRKSINSWADKLAMTMDANDPIKASGDLNYAITAVLWGITGSAAEIETASYGFRCYLRGILEKVKEMIVPLYGTGNNETVMNYRRHLIVKGVMGDVMDEWYAQQMCPYERVKEAENGPIWHDGRLYVKGEA